MNTITRLLLFSTSLIITLLWYTCSDEPTKPPPDQHSDSVFINLQIEDVICIDIWLEVTMSDSTRWRRVLLTRDGQKIFDRRVLSNDTLLVDRGVQPNRFYTYQAFRLKDDSTVVAKSRIITATTMDTTNHTFSQQETYTFGDGAGSVLLDVAIINDTLAYAVGDIEGRDSTGNWDPLPYNLAKWNGFSWELKRVSVMFRGNLITPPLYSIFAFSASDIWLSSGVPIHGDNKNWIQYHLFDMGVLTQNDGSINKIWGTPGDIYFVGNRGTIAQFTNGTWRRIESGTTANIQDVWGYYEEKTKENVVLCAVSNVFEPGDRKILRIYPNGKVDALKWRTDRRIHSIWFNNINQIFTTGGGVFIRQADGQWNEQTSVPLYYTRRVRGSMFNDVFVAGDFGLIAHYNGVSWYHWQNQTAAIWYSCSYRDGLFMAVGQTPDQKGVVTIIRR